MIPPEKQVLFVDDDAGLLAGLRNALRTERRRWGMRFALGGEEALRLLAEQPADVVVSDMRMPGMDGLELLARVKHAWPETARVVLSGHADLSAVARAAALAHQYLLKPIDVEGLRQVLGRLFELQEVLARQPLRQVVGSMGSLPSAPRVFQALTEALEDPDVPMDRLADLVESDVALSARVLQFVNSAYCGLIHPVASIEQAIVYLGVSTLRHLALTVELFRAFRPGPEGEAIFRQLERHAQLTARVARRLSGQPLPDQDAFAAGLLHDTGKLIFMSRLPDAYAAALAQARAEGATPCEAERRVIGADHAELGAHLLGLWGLPLGIVEPVAFHHDDAHLEARGGPALTVAVADLLAHLVEWDDEEPDEAQERRWQRLERLAALPGAPPGGVATWRAVATAESEELPAMDPAVA